MQFPNPPVADGYYWIDIHGDPGSLMILHWSRRRNGIGWAYQLSEPFLFRDPDQARAINVRSERIVFAEPKAPAEPEPIAAPATRAPGSAAPNTAIDAIIAEVMARAVNQDIAALAVAIVTSEDQILSDQSANPHMGSRLLAGADLLLDKVRQAVKAEAARSTT